MRLEQKTALITGGRQGFGRAIVDAFVAEGAQVMTCGRGPRPDDLPDDILWQTANMANREDVDRLRHEVVARLGVLSFDAEKLTPRHFNGSFDENTLVQGLPRGGTLYRTILDDGPTLDVARAREEVVAMAHTLQSRTPDLDLLLLECTNLSPFKRDLRQSTRLPVFDLVDALMWIHEAAAVR